MNNDNTDTIVISHIGSIYELFDPRYIRIGREPARIILNMSLSTFQRREKDDPEFPKGSKSSLKHGAARNYILQDVYNYSAYLTQKEIELENNQLNKTNKPNK